jgi:hypothetical protein
MVCRLIGKILRSDAIMRLATVSFPLALCALSPSGERGRYMTDILVDLLIRLGVITLVMLFVVLITSESERCFIKIVRYVGIGLFFLTNIVGIAVATVNIVQ